MSRAWRVPLLLVALFLGQVLLGEPAFSGFALHSHNDFDQKRPLQDAFDARISSVEVDVVDRWGEVRLTHIGIFTSGTLREAYLDPLQKRVDQLGSVLGDGKPFYLWIELRGFFTRAGIVPLLRELLARYPMLARFDSSGALVKEGPVVAILSGYSGYKHDYFEGLAVSPACLALNDHEWSRLARKEGQGFDARAKWLSLRWSRFSDWDGKGAPPPGLKEMLGALLGRIHARGKRVRFWGNPEAPAFYRLMRETGVDLASTDTLSPLEALTSPKPTAPTPR